MSKKVNAELFVPDTMPTSAGYSHVTIVSGETSVFIGRQVALDGSGHIVGPTDFRAQVQQVFENLAAAIAAAGGTFNDVLKLNSYFLDFKHLSDFREVRDRYINLRTPPLSTVVQVTKLFRPQFLVEIEVVALIRKKTSECPGQTLPALGLVRLP